MSNIGKKEPPVTHLYRITYTGFSEFGVQNLQLPVQLRAESPEEAAWYAAIHLATKVYLPEMLRTLHFVSVEQIST